MASLALPSDTLSYPSLEKAREMALVVVKNNDLRTLRRIAAPGTSSWVEFASSTQWWKAATSHQARASTLSYMAAQGAFRGGVEAPDIETGLRTMAHGSRPEVLQWVMAQPLVTKVMTVEMWSNVLWAGLHSDEPCETTAMILAAPPPQGKTSLRNLALARTLVGSGRKGIVSALRALLANGVSVDTVFEGKTALQAAISDSNSWWEHPYSGPWHAIQTLLEAGASLTLKDGEGVSALDRARKVLESVKPERIHEEARRFWGPRILEMELMEATPRAEACTPRPRL